MCKCSMCVFECAAVTCSLRKFSMMKIFHTGASDSSTSEKAILSVCFLTLSLTAFMFPYLCVHMCVFVGVLAVGAS